VDPTGAVVQSVDLTKTHFGWSQPDLYTVIYTSTTIVNEKMPHVNFSSTLVNNAIFTVDAYFYNVDSVVSSNKRNDVKFTVTIQNWPWAGVGSYVGEQQNFYVGNVLVLTAGLAGYGGIERHYIHSGGATIGDLVQADFTFATLVSPDMGSYDPNTPSATIRPVAISYTTSGKPTVSWTFTYFQTEVIYDPWTTPQAGAAASFNYTSPGMITLWAILGLILIGGLIGGIAYITMGKKSRRLSKIPDQSTASDVNL